MERSKAGTTERSSDGLSLPNQNTIIFIIIIILYCLTSLDSRKPIEKRISVNHEGFSTPITT